jgi:hypothetical protein
VLERTWSFSTRFKKREKALLSFLMKLSSPKEKPKNLNKTL